MAQRLEPHTRPWIAFVAGAVAMLAIVLVWLALSRSRDAVGTLRANVALPTTELPSIPATPPPEGPRLPQLPAPTPR